MKFFLANLFFIFLMFLAGCKTSKRLTIDPQVDILNLQNTVKVLSSIDPPRNYQNTDSLMKASQYITKQLESYGYHVVKQKYMVADKAYHNLIAHAGPEHGPQMVIGAHYDVCGDQPGADDNASGIAGLLEIARFAKENEDKLKLGFDFVAFTLEEPPFFATKEMGSFIHASYLKKNRKKIKGMVCLEMIGYFSERRRSQDYPLSLMKWFYPKKGNFIAVVGNLDSFFLAKKVADNLCKSSVDVERLIAPSFIKGVDFSDHRNYWKFGYDAVMITDTAFFRNRHYHEKSDTFETLNYEKMQEIVKGLCMFILG